MERAMSRVRLPGGADRDLSRAAPRFLDDPALDPFWQAMAEMKVLLIFHTNDVKPAAGLREYFLHNCIGYPLQSTVAVARMMFGGVFTRFPDLMVKIPPWRRPAAGADRALPPRRRPPPRAALQGLQG